MCYIFKMPTILFNAGQILSYSYTEYTPDIPV